MSPVFDSHCHLDPRAFEDEAGIDAAVARAKDAGVLRMVTIGSGYGADTARAAVDVAARNDGVWATVGVHPHDAKLWDDAMDDAVQSLATRDKVVALGEMGLDFHYDNSPRDVQRTVLRRQLALARELDLPVVIHDRESADETLEILLAERAFEGKGVLFHCYSGDVATMRRIVGAGGYVSIPGIVTFKKAETMRAVAKATPPDRLLVETDSPFLTPIPFRGKRNEPAYVVHTVAAIAAERGETPEAIARLTWDNASRFFGVP
jgi:TatD DNase family protein